MKLRLFTILLSLFIAAQTAFSAPLSGNAKTKRIPAGTRFVLELLNPISSTANENTEFSAILSNDQITDNEVILPSGSLVRGTIKRIVPARRFSRGAIVYLDFDHVVTPNGRQLPLSLSVVGRNDMTLDGGITSSRGYKEAVKENWDKTVEITKNATEWGVHTGEDVINGYAKIITVPVGAVGGGIGGGAYFIGDSAADMFRKGKNVNIEKGTKIEVILAEPIDVPII